MTGGLTLFKVQQDTSSMSGIACCSFVLLQECIEKKNKTTVCTYACIYTKECELVIVCSQLFNRSFGATISTYDRSLPFA